VNLGEPGSISASSMRYIVGSMAPASTMGSSGN